MKKMFCLMLVAVLLVSAVPAAFAEGEYPAEIQCEEHNKPANRLEAYDVAATCTTEGKIAYFCEPGIEGVSSHKVWYSRAVPKLGHAPGDEATCTTAQICTRCNETLVSALTHNWLDATCSAPKSCSRCDATEGAQLDHQFADATCTEPQKCTRKDCTATNGTALGHTYGSDTVCDVCKYCNACGKTITDNDAKNHDTKCQYHPEFNKECGKCGTEYTALETHPTCETCNNVNAKAGNPCHATANCPYCEVCLAKDDYVKNHTTADHCETCGKTDGTHRTDCKYAKCSNCNGAHATANCTNNGEYDLKIYATMWTGDGREETVYLGTFYNLSTNTKIAEYMKENDTRIHEWAAERCSGYKWEDGKIYENKKSTDEIEYNDRIGYSDKEAYINVKRDSKDVVLFLHTSRTYVDHDWIKVEGKTTNDTLTLDEAKDIVKKYYSFSSLKMYSNDDWNEYVDGNNNIEAQKAVEIGSGNVTKIHILMSGSSAKTSSGTSSTSKADSSNPKTGDAIFAPVAVMGLSVSALAVLYFLNKKRAY